MAPGAVKKVVILGGGTAGWMTAAALIKAMPQTAIVLIESEEIGIIGVGEATVPSISMFNAMLGLDVPDFMRACEATFKLGIQFVDWGRLGARYMHPFTNFGADVTSPDFGPLWMRYALAHGEACPIDDYNLACVASAEGRFMLPRRGQAMAVGPLSYAFHFDAALYARYLRAYAEARGAVRIEGKAVAVGQDTDRGDITNVTLESGRVIDGDYFVDCSGFQGVLIEQTLKAGYDDWSHWLPCDRAVAVPSENMGPPAPFTRSTADAAGWRWRIPLQHRVGNGHVYASRFMDDGEAERRLLGGLEGPALAEPRQLRFVTGKRRRAWVGNCTAIGLSSGFLEPLESTSIYMIQTAILRLLGALLHTGLGPDTVLALNRQADTEFENIRDFIILHYKRSVRDDSEFWRYCRDMDVPDAVAANMAMFATTGRVRIPKDHPFPMQGWLAVMLGQGGLPDALDPALPDMPLAELARYVEESRQAVAAMVDTMPTQEAFLKLLLTPQAGVLNVMSTAKVH